MDLRAGAALAFVMALSAPGLADSPAPAVRVEALQADLEFLASDALRGRGSATPDELVAATYVASRRSPW
jgi:aminopeptidase YwaD